MQSKNSIGAEAARVRALAAYKDFLTLWKDADPDILQASESRVCEAAVAAYRRRDQTGFSFHDQ